jgi:lipopolysaccharide/colanic/teichoic acid biosynthesis glycosyltransferase
MGLDSTEIELEPDAGGDLSEALGKSPTNGSNGTRAALNGSAGALNGGGVMTLDASRNGHAPARPGDLDPPYAVPARVLKRTADLIGSLLLIVLLAPLWIAIALLIKADSPGPILFRQRRIGRDGRPFWMLKFRTMVDGADARKPALLHLNDAADGLFKIYDDPRVTRIGRWLRATCLDELPQLLHVAAGRMSLVGPRPLVPEEDGQIRGVYRERLTMRPGMTGPWQVEGASAIPIHGMVLLDRYYIEEWSLWLDLRLLGRTASIVIQRRGI